MAKNPERRLAILDAGLRVLAREGSRGLTHRAVDSEAGLPQGTCVNYLRTRDALYHALGERIFERLTPSPEALEESSAKPPSRARLIALMHELMERIQVQPELQIALLELRLESTRRPALERTLTETLRSSLELDVAFHARAGLPGGRLEVVLLHLAMEGLILNTFTLPDVLEVAGRDEFIDELVTRLVPS